MYGSECAIIWDRSGNVAIYVGPLVAQTKTNLTAMMFDNVMLQICLCQYIFTLVMPSRVFLWTAEYNNADDGHRCERMVNASLTMCIGKLNLTHWGRNKFPPFSRHFQMHFLDRKHLNFDWDFTGVCSQGSNWQYTSIGSDNGWATIMRQAIIWTNDGWFTDAYMRQAASIS